MHYGSTHCYQNFSPGVYDSNFGGGLFFNEWWVVDDVRLDVNLQYDGMYPTNFVLTNRYGYFNPVSVNVSMTNLHPGIYIGSASFPDGTSLTIYYNRNSVSNSNDFTVDIDIYGEAYWDDL